MFMGSKKGIKEIRKNTVVVNQKQYYKNVLNLKSQFDMIYIGHKGNLKYANFRTT